MKSRPLLASGISQFLCRSFLNAQLLILTWSAYAQYHSGKSIGLIYFSHIFLFAILSPIAGAFSDRWNCKKALIFLNMIMICYSLLAAFCLSRGGLEIWHYLLFAGTLGCIDTFESSLRLSLNAKISQEANLPNSFATLVMIVNLGRIIGPLNAGLVMMFKNIPLGVASFSFFYFCSIIMLLTIKINRSSIAFRVQNKILVEILNTSKLILNSSTLKTYFSIGMINSFAAGSIPVFLPILNKNVLFGTEQSLAYLTGSVGIGAISSTFVLKPIGMDSKRYLKIMTTAIVCFGIAILLLNTIKSFPLFFVVGLLLGFSLTKTTALNGSAIQQETMKSGAGKSIGLLWSFQYIFYGCGNMMAGWLNDFGGTGFTIIFFGLFLLLAVGIVKLCTMELKPSSNTGV